MRSFDLEIVTRGTRLETLKSLIAELSENARQPQNELHGWDHKREYRRLRDLAMKALKEIKSGAKREPQGATK